MHFQDLDKLKKNLLSLDNASRNRVLLIFEKDISNSKKINDNSKIDLLRRIGNISYQDFALTATAILFWKKALSFVSNSDIIQKHSILGNIGVAYCNNGYYKKAIRYQENVYRKCKNIDEKVASNALLNLGIVYGHQGLYQNALDNINESINIKERIKDYKGLSNCYTAIGVTNKQLGNFTKSIKFHRRSLRLKRILKITKEEAHCLGNIAVTFRAQSEKLKDEKKRRMSLLKSIRYLEQAISISEYEKDSNHISKCYVNLGRIYISLGDLQEAETYLQSALDIKINKLNLQDKESEAICYVNLGSLYFEKKDYHSALTFYKYSAQIFSKNQDTYLDAYSGIANCYVKMGHKKKALNTYKKVVKISESLITTFNLEEDIVNYHSKISEIYDNLFILLPTNKDRFIYSQKAKTITFNLSKAVLDRRNKIKTLKLKQLQSNLRINKRMIIIDYFLLNKYLYIFCVTKDNFQSFKVRLSNIDKKVEDFIEIISDPYANINKVNNIIYYLSKKIIYPIESLLKENNIELIYFVSHKILNKLPIHVLKLKNGDNIIQNYEICYLPNINQLLFINQQKKLKLPSCLAIGFDYKNISSSFSEEAVSIYTFFKRLNKQSGLLTNKNISKESLIEKLVKHKYNIIHFSCHGIHNNVNLFYRYEIPIYKKSFLDYNFFQKISSDIDMIVLSTCNSSLGEIIGHDYINLGRILSYSGCNSVVSTYWQVGEYDTIEFSKIFYEYLLNGDTKSKALQKACIERKNITNNTLHAWAGFGLSGNWQ